MQFALIMPIQLTKILYQLKSTYLSLAALNERLLSFFVLSQIGASMVGISRG